MSLDFWFGPCSQIYNFQAWFACFSGGFLCYLDSNILFCPNLLEHMVAGLQRWLAYEPHLLVVSLALNLSESCDLLMTEYAAVTLWLLSPVSRESLQLPLAPLRMFALKKLEFGTQLPWSEKLKPHREALSYKDKSNFKKRLNFPCWK